MITTTPHYHENGSHRKRKKKKSFPIKKWDRRPKNIMSKEKIIEYQVNFNKVFVQAGKFTKEVLTKYIVF